MVSTSKASPETPTQPKRILGKIYLYDEQLKKKGIDRDSDLYRNYVAWTFSWIDKNRTYYGFLLNRLVRRKTYRIQTMAVVFKKTHIELWYNPDFACLYPLRMLAGCFQHEALHIILKHPARAEEMGAGNFHDDGLNMLAAECSVNTHIQHPADLPSFAIKPGLFKVPAEGLERDEWPNMQERMSYEDYYETLKEIAEKDPWQIPATMSQKQEEAAGGGEGGECIVITEGSDPTDGDQFGNIGPCENLDGEKSPAEIFDEHRGWFAEKGMTGDDIVAVIDYEVRQANNQAKAQGHLPAHLKNVIEDIYGAKSVPWNSLFRGMVSRAMSFTRVRAPVRPNRRTMEPSGSRFEPEIEIYIYVDVSGSMSDDEFALAMAEAKNAARMDGVNVSVQQFECDLAGPLTKIDKYKRSPTSTRNRYGGTSFTPVVNDIDEKKPDLAFIVTDGEAERTNPTSVPTAWILTHDGQMQSWGKHVRLPPPQEARRLAAKIIR
jgi:predicted metal-dependent peptidase